MSAIQVFQYCCCVRVPPRLLAIRKGIDISFKAKYFGLLISLTEAYWLEERL